MQLPRGYETVVGERGVKLSGGQKQRLSIARAFLFDPRILILDEPTSSVEPETEALIQTSLEELSASRTTLVVTHRIALLRKARRILFLRHGRVEADGDHETLLLTCPRMPRLTISGRRLSGRSVRSSDALAIASEMTLAICHSEYARTSVLAIL